MSSDESESNGDPPSQNESKCEGEEESSPDSSVRAAFLNVDLSDVINEQDSVDHAKEWILTGKIDVKHFDKVLPFTAQDLRTGKTDGWLLVGKLQRVLYSTLTVCDDQDGFEGLMTQLVARRLAPLTIEENWCRNDEQKQWLSEHAYPAFARDLFVRCDGVQQKLLSRPHVALPWTDIAAPIQKALHETCHTWAPQVDAVIFAGKPSPTFLFLCQTYKLSSQEFADLVRDTFHSIMPEDAHNQHSKHQSFIHLRVKQMREALSVACEDTFENSCWECCTVGTLSTPLQHCSQCSVALYCSRECQTRAWKGGHKGFCKRLLSEYSSFMESIGAIDRAHEAETRIEGHKLNHSVDYLLAWKMYEGAPLPFPSIYIGEEEHRIPGPKMEYFYKNLARIFRGEWWVFDNPNTMEAYKQKLMPRGSSFILPKKVDWNLFGSILICLTYDILWVFEEDEDDASERAGFVHALIKKSVAWVDKEKLGATMPVERFIKLYDESKEEDSLAEQTNKNVRSRLKINVKAATTAYFRNNFHK